MLIEEKLLRISQLSCFGLFIICVIWTSSQFFSNQPISWWYLLMSFFTLISAYSEDNYYILAAIVWCVLAIIGFLVIVGIIVGQLGFNYFDIKVPYLHFIVFGTLYSFLIWLPEIGLFFGNAKSGKTVPS